MSIQSTFLVLLAGCLTLQEAADVPGFTRNQNQACSGAKQYYFESDAPQYKCSSIGLSEVPCYDTSNMTKALHRCATICNAIQHCAGFGFLTQDMPLEDGSVLKEGRCIPVTSYNNNMQKHCNPHGAQGMDFYKHNGGKAEGNPMVDSCDTFDPKEVRAVSTSSSTFSGTCKEFVSKYGVWTGQLLWHEYVVEKGAATITSGASSASQATTPSDLQAATKAPAPIGFLTSSCSPAAHILLAVLVLASPAVCNTHW
jgi:hypothetical protein